MLKVLDFGLTVLMEEDNVDPQVIVRCTQNLDIVMQLVALSEKRTNWVARKAC